MVRADIVSGKGKCRAECGRETNPGGATPTFGVQDIKAAEVSLRSKDVRIDGDIVTIKGMVSLLMFYDQDNNSLMFYQDLASDA